MSDSTGKRPTCGKGCPHFILTDVGRGECHFAPPTSMLTPMGGGAMGFAGVWAPVGSKTPCCALHPDLDDWKARFLTEHAAKSLGEDEQDEAPEDTPPARPAPQPRGGSANGAGRLFLPGR